MIYIIIGSIIFFACVIMARMQNEKGLKILTREQAGELVQANSKTRMVFLFILMSIIIGFLLVAYFLKVDKMLAMIGYFVAITGYYIAAALAGLSRVKKLGFPADYMKFTMQATLLRLGGLVVFMIFMGIGLASNL